MKKWILGVLVICLVFLIGSELYSTFKKSNEKESFDSSRVVQATDLTP